MYIYIYTHCLSLSAALRVHKVYDRPRGVGPYQVVAHTSANGVGGSCWTRSELPGFVLANSLITLLRSEKRSEGICGNLSFS